MQGTVTTYLPEKRYGFIKGKDGKDYFFHENAFINKSDILALAENVIVEFEQKATPRGYQAKECRVLSTIEDMKYVQPNHFIATKQNRIKGWEVIESSEWLVSAFSGDSPDSAKDILIERAQQIGANAIINLRYSKSTGSTLSSSGKGTYFFSIHHFRGCLVTIGKRDIKGTYSKKDLSGINEKAESLYNELEEEENSKINNVTKGFVVTLLVSLTTSVMGELIWLYVLVIGGVISASLYSDTEIWLEKIENEHLPK